MLRKQNGVGEAYVTGFGEGDFHKGRFKWLFIIGLFCKIASRFGVNALLAIINRHPGL